MKAHYQIPEPVLFNPLKHHLLFLREYITLQAESEYGNDTNYLIRELKHIGTSVTDIYNGSLSVEEICNEVKEFLEKKGYLMKEAFSSWAGKKMNEFKVIPLSDGSQWTLKFHENKMRFVHIFPARKSQHTFRVKSNTLKSALLYIIMIGKDFISGDDLNRVRIMTGLSPIKDPVDNEAITEMIEILRN